MSFYKTQDDIKLVGLLKKGDELAFNEIYLRYWPLLFRHARRMLHDEDEALDIVQDIFTNLWTKSEDLFFTTSLSAYLYTSVRNKTINVINKGKLHKNYVNSLQEFINKGTYETDDQIRYNEFATRIENEVNNLPPKMREIFKLRKDQGLSYKQIAQQLNLADETVKKQVYRALKTLRTRLSAFLFSLSLTPLNFIFYFNSFRLKNKYF